MRHVYQIYFDVRVEQEQNKHVVQITEYSVGNHIAIKLYLKPNFILHLLALECGQRSVCHSLYTPLFTLGIF